MSVTLFGMVRDTTKKNFMYMFIMCRTDDYNKSTVCMFTKVGLRAQYMHAHVGREITSRTPNSDCPRHAVKDGQGNFRVVAVVPDGPGHESGIRVSVYLSAFDGWLCWTRL